jgi:serpin B
MPSFDASAELTLTEAVKALGLAEDFTPAANFPAFGNVYLHEVKHKAVLEVDENGTRGAAASNAGMLKYGISEYKELVLDRPFLYMVFDRKTSAPLFLGAVTNF